MDPRRRVVVPCPPLPERASRIPGPIYLAAAAETEFQARGQRDVLLRLQLVRAEGNVIEDVQSHRQPFAGGIHAHSQRQGKARILKALPQAIAEPEQGP